MSSLPRPRPIVPSPGSHRSEAVAPAPLDTGPLDTGPDEAALVRAACLGDRLSFRALYELTGPSALRLAERIVRTRELAEEVCQEAFCQAWARLKTFRGDARFRTWVLTIVRNAALDLLRRERARRRHVTAAELPDVADTRPAPEAPLRERELQAALDEALGELPEETRSAFTLAVLDQLSYTEVAAVLGGTTDGVKCRVYRAREHLRRRLEAFREQRS